MRAFVLFIVVMLPVDAWGQLLRGLTMSDQVTEDDVYDAGDWGPNVVRYPLEHLGTFANEDEAGFYARLERGMDKLDALLPAFEANGIKVIIVMYSPPGGYTTVKRKTQHRIFSEMWAQQALINGWIAVANRYKDSSTVWGYDLVNEPAEVKVAKKLLNWAKLSTALAYHIRSIDPTHKIIIETVYGNPSLINKHKRIPLPGIVYSIHIYYPQKFAQQGLHGYPLGVAYPTKKLARKHVEKLLKPVLKFQRKHGVEIYVGEYSVVRWAPGASAYNYLADLMTLMDQYGWHSTYHAFRDAHPWSAEHSDSYFDYNPSPSRTDREMLLRQYFSRN